MSSGFETRPDIDNTHETLPPAETGGLWGRLGRAMRRGFSRVFSRKHHAPQGEYDVNSKFKHFYSHMDRDDPLYPTVRQAATLCDDALRVAHQRMRASTQLHNVNEKLNEIDAFIRLTDEEMEDLRKMLDRYVALSNERRMLLEKLTNYDASLVDMTPLEEAAWEAVPTIKEAEKQQRALRQDLGYLMGEKEELIHERTEMNHSLTFIHKFTIGAVGLFVLVALALGYQFFFLRSYVFVPTFILVLLIMGIVSLLHFFRLRIRKEMRLNLRKQHKAIELLNKKSVVYAYYTNFLRFVYNKYKVNNARNLEGNLKDLESYRQLTNRIDTVRSLLYETEEAVDRFIRVKRLGGVKATLEGFAKTVDLDDKKRLHDQLARDKRVAEKTLNELDSRHEEIWESLIHLNDRDSTQQVGAVIEMYLTEAGKLFTVEAVAEAQTA